MSRRIKLAGAVVVSLVVLVAAGFYGWTRVARYAAFPEARAVAERAERVQGWNVFAPDGEPIAGFVFYPGGLVDAAAYAPLMQRLADGGFLAVIVPMPLELAVFGIGRAADVIALLASYPAEATDLSTLPIRAVSTYGTENGLTPPEGFEASLSRLPPGTELVVIEGGNHAGFGHYGPQAGDGVASIDREEQQRQTVETVLAFVRELP